jgi:hypothetical protein
MSWPPVRAVQSARRGIIRQVLKTPEGNVPGLESSTTHVWAAIGPPGSIAACDLCGTREKEPDPPGASADPTGPRSPLLAPGTQAHACYILTWLHQFEAAHQHPVHNTPETEE